MFLYVTFLRPPPIEAQLGRPLVITPQISNDLRTELCEREADIYYAWLPQDGAISRNTTLTKLTTWRPSTAYKDVNIFPPKEAQYGHKWRLYLCVGASAGIADIDLVQTRPPFGSRPFPVLSTPITFINHTISAEGSSKQVQIERNLAIPSQGRLVLREHLAFDLDKKVWDSGIGLSHWLAHSFNLGKDECPEIVNWMSQTDKLGVVELGSGTGLVSVVLASLLASAPDVKCNKIPIFATDLPSAMEVIETNIGLNRSILSDKSTPLARVLDWGDETLPREIEEVGVDLIIMSDVTYNTASFPSLVRTLDKLAHSSNSSNEQELSTSRRNPPRVLLAYKERDPAERSLWATLRDIGLSLTEIATVPGAAGAPVEIYAGVFE